MEKEEKNCNNHSETSNIKQSELRREKKKSMTCHWKRKKFQKYCDRQMKEFEQEGAVRFANVEHYCNDIRHEF